MCFPSPLILISNQYATFEKVSLKTRNVRSRVPRHCCFPGGACALLLRKQSAAQARPAADFGDAQLERILQEALEHNFDLKVAAGRLEASLANSRVGRSGALPSLNLNGSGSKSLRNPSATGTQQTRTAETYQLNARFGWEIDLWGQVRNGYRGDLADAEAAVADYRAARLSIAARTAQAWYAAVEASQQYALEERILGALEESSRIVEENFESGIAGALDVRLVRANLASWTLSGK